MRGYKCEIDKSYFICMYVLKRGIKYSRIVLRINSIPILCLHTYVGISSMNEMSHAHKWISSIIFTARDTLCPLDCQKKKWRNFSAWLCTSKSNTEEDLAKDLCEQKLLFGFCATIDRLMYVHTCVVKSHKTGYRRIWYTSAVVL